MRDMKKIFGYLALATLFSCSQAKAHEGFWLPSQLARQSPVLQNLTLPVSTQGSELPLSQVLPALGKIDNCTAAFVSAQGLLLTSYRCIAPYLSGVTLSSQTTADAELPIPGLQLHLPVQTQDVTVTINRQLNSDDPKQDRAARFDAIKEQLLRDCRQQKDIQCELKSLHNGLEYYLLQYRVLRDIRLVYAPEPTGADTAQNWPRYSADYLFLRAYTGGERSAGVTAGKPYRTAFVRLAEQGVQEDELVFAASFAKSSQRYSNSDEIRFHFEQLLPKAKQYQQQAALLLEQLVPAGSVRAAQYGPTLAELKHNASEIDAMLQHYQRSNVLAARQHRQQQLLQWINSSPVRQQLYGPVLNRLDTVLNRAQAMAQRDLVLSYLKYAQLPQLANQLYQHALQQEPEQREQLKQRLSSLDAHFDARVDLEMALHFLEQYAKLPKNLHLPALDQYFALSDGFSREIVRHKLSAMYRGTSLTGAPERLVWLERSSEQFRSSADPLLSFSVAMHDTVLALRAERAQLQTDLDIARSALMEVIMAFHDAQGLETYAEANGMLRISLGQVKGYEPVDAVWYRPFSKLGAMVPSVSQPEVIDAATAAIAVNFLSSIDSGSDYGAAPTFNHKGEVVGVMFAGVAENLLTDWYYDAGISRAVHVDSRFIRWQLQQTAQGRALLQELQLNRP